MLRNIQGQFFEVFNANLTNIFEEFYGISKEGLLKNLRDIETRFFKEF